MEACNGRRTSRSVGCSSSFAIPLLASDVRMRLFGVYPRFITPQTKYSHAQHCRNFRTRLGSFILCRSSTCQFPVHTPLPFCARLAAQQTTISELNLTASIPTLTPGLCIPTHRVCPIIFDFPLAILRCLSHHHCCLC